MVPRQRQDESTALIRVAGQRAAQIHNVGTAFRWVQYGIDARVAQLDLLRAAVESEEVCHVKTVIGQPVVPADHTQRNGDTPRQQLPVKGHNM